MKEKTVLRVAVNELQRGMYVSQLDRPWLETPFPIQGFYIHRKEDIKELERYCSFVYIDYEKGKKPHLFGITRAANSEPKKKRAAGATITQLETKDTSRSAAKKSQATATMLFPHRSYHAYPDTSTMEVELISAKQVYKDLSESVVSMMDAYTQTGTMEIGQLKEAVTPMVDSVIRNPDACTWLARLKDKDSYAFRHSIGTAVWTTALGRQLGLPKTDLQRLSMGALLADIGKVSLPQEVLLKADMLTQDEFALIRSHVEAGVKMIKESGGVSMSSIEIVQCHHERHGGHGYPRGLRGDEIPVFARIASIADCYDAITSPRPYGMPLSPSAAIKKLYEWRDIDFQAELVEEFIQAIGIYPAGTLVELSSGEVAVVVAEYRTRRLRPQVLVILDRNKKPLATMKMINLLTELEDDSGKALEIVTSLEPGAYDIKSEDLYLCL